MGPEDNGTLKSRPYNFYGVKIINKYLPIILILAVISGSLFFPADGETARARITSKTNTPYRGAIVVRDDTGETVFDKNADISCYPASIVKLMMLLIIQEKIEEGSLNLDDSVVCTAEASRMGGSQVYLKENEIFTIEDLLYSLIIQSANDSAVALAIHVAGSKDGFVEMMRAKGRELGMNDTEFHSVHGLPPGRDRNRTSVPRMISRSSAGNFSGTRRYSVIPPRRSGVSGTIPSRCGATIRSWVASMGATASRPDTSGPGVSRSRPPPSGTDSA